MFLKYDKKSLIFDKKTHIFYTKIGLVASDIPCYDYPRKPNTHLSRFNILR
jgi:hypothetical protein